MRIPSWQLTQTAEPFCNVSNAPVLYALPHLRQHHRPSATDDGSKGVDAILSTLHVILQGKGGCRHWTGVQSPHKNFTFLSRSSSSPSSTSRSSWLVVLCCTSNGSSPLRTPAVSCRRVTMCLGVLQSGQCLHHVPLEQNAVPAPNPQHSIALSIWPSVDRFCTLSLQAHLYQLPTVNIDNPLLSRNITRLFYFTVEPSRRPKTSIVILCQPLQYYHHR